jgi:hypothetical protein
METINFVIVLGFILTWFLIVTLSKQVKKNRDMIMTGMLAASKYIDAKIDKKDKDIYLQIEVDTINKVIEYLKLNEKGDTDGIKVRYVRQALTIPFGRKWEE